MRSAARVRDVHICPKRQPDDHRGGQITQGFPRVQIESRASVRAGDMARCAVPGPNVIVEGSASVLIGGMPAARQFDKLAHGGQILSGASLVLVGGATVTPPSVAAIIENADEIERLKSRVEKRKERLAFIERYLRPDTRSLEEKALEDAFKRITFPSTPGLPPSADSDSDRVSRDHAEQEAHFERKQLEAGVRRDQERIRQLEAENEAHRQGKPVTPTPPDPDLDKPIVTQWGDNAEPR